MTFDIVLAGVGGQGVLSLSGIIATASLDAGLFVKQSEVHGMAQRGGAVTAHLRLSNRPISSDLIPYGSASLILSLEPLESLRYLHLLSPEGTVVSATQPINNIGDYPSVDSLLDAIRTLPHAVLVDATTLARQAGLSQATNMVMAGAASRLLPIDAYALEACIRTKFSRKGEAVVTRNLAAFDAGRVAGRTAGRWADRENPYAD